MARAYSTASSLTERPDTGLQLCTPQSMLPGCLMMPGNVWLIVLFKLSPTMLSGSCCTCRRAADAQPHNAHHVCLAVDDCILRGVRTNQKRRCPRGCQPAYSPCMCYYVVDTTPEPLSVTTTVIFSSWFLLSSVRITRGPRSKTHYHECLDSPFPLATHCLARHGAGFLCRRGLTDRDESYPRSHAARISDDSWVSAHCEPRQYQTSEHLIAPSSNATSCNWPPQSPRPAHDQ